MAYQMAYKDERLTEHPASIWLPMFVSFDHGSKNGRIVFDGYSSLSALAANAPVIGQKSYDISGETYLSVVAPVLDVVSQRCYDYASTVHDKDDGQGEKVPFFSTATEFALPTSPPPPPVSPPPPPVSPPPPPVSPPPAPPAPEEPTVEQVG